MKTKRSLILVLILLTLASCVQTVLAQEAPERAAVAGSVPKLGEVIDVIDKATTSPSGQEQTQPEIIFKINERVVLNYYSAKRLAITLSQLIRRHEEQFGELELDVAKRRKNDV